ncbi:hypothetical protein LEP1GSC087_2186 [Leptospira interrogans serovar Bataviae str. L1111]|nr:hypothetical protein LEP1GSC087_2186 [Leptospira interrogans serovar Bataviae str. L1111]
MIAVDSLDKTIIQESLQSHKRELDSLGGSGYSYFRLSRKERCKSEK